jgi:O-antigen/teichoic acid export membrane protein
MREIARSHGRFVLDKEPVAGGSYTLSPDDNDTIRRVIRINFIIAGIITICFLVYFLLVGNANKIEITCTWLAYSLSIIFNLAASPKRGFLEGSGRLDLERYLSTVCYIVMSLAILLSAYFSRALLPMTLSVLGGSALTYAVLSWQCKTLSENGDSSRALLSLGLKGIFREGFGFSWVSIGAVLTKSSFAPIVTGFLGSATLAPVFFATKVFATVSIAVTILVTSERATIARVYASGDSSTVRRLVHRALLVNVVSSILIGGVLTLSLGLGIAGLMGKAYTLHWSIYAVLYGDLVLNNFGAACAHFVNAMGKNPFKLSVSLSGLVTVAGLFALVPVFGLAGAVVAPVFGGLLTSYWFNPYQLHKLLVVDGEASCI